MTNKRTFSFTVAYGDGRSVTETREITLANSAGGAMVDRFVANIAAETARMHAARTGGTVTSVTIDNGPKPTSGRTMQELADRTTAEGRKLFSRRRK